MLKAEEAAGAPPGAPRRPRALVLGPTRELTDQLLRVAKALAHHEKFRSVCINGGAHALNSDVSGSPFTRRGRLICVSMEPAVPFDMVIMNRPGHGAYSEACGIMAAVQS